MRNITNITSAVVIISCSKKYPNVIVRDIVTVERPLAPYTEDENQYNKLWRIANHISIMRAKVEYNRMWGDSRIIMDAKPWSYESKYFEKVNLNKIY